MGYSDEQLDAAVSAAMRKPTFHDELREAVYLCLENGLTLADILGETRRASVAAALKITKSKKAAAKKLDICRQTMSNIETHTHKF
jgi:hypothetical protein